MTTPSVTVVIICYNDEARLPRAIRSARRQTLSDIEINVVDHGSTDGSLRVAQDAAAEDPRVRVIPLGEHEGKPGRPINAGIDAATAPWVVVVGSDDILRRRGCETLLAAAERSQADVVIGGVRRVDMDTREAIRWMPSVTLRSRVVKDVSQFPDLIRDTIGGFKLYRTEFLRDNGLRFAEDIFYQDQVFTIECFASAATVAIVSKFVGDWRHWYSSERKSVTQRKTTVENLADRIEANRRIDRFLVEHGRHDLLLIKQRKFLTHDLSVHVKDVGQAPTEYRRSLVALTQEYTESMPVGAFDGIPLNKWLMVRCLQAGRLDDAERVLGSHFVQMLTEWDHVETSAGSFLLPPWLPREPDPVFEVSRYRLDEIPDRLRPARGWVTVRPAGRSLAFEVTIGSRGRSDMDGADAGRLLFRDPVRGRATSVDLGPPERLDALRRRWRTRISRRRLDRAIGRGDESVEIHAVFHPDRDDEWSVRLRPTPETGQEAREGAEEWRPTVLEQQLCLTRKTRRSRWDSLAERTVRSGDRADPAPDPWEELTLEQARDYLSDHPGKRRAAGVFFESFAGRRIGGGPLAVSRRLNRRNPKIKQYWSCTPFSLPQVPSYAEAAPRFTRRYVDLLAGSQIWFDNGWLPFDPDGRQLVQLWHGVPLTRIPSPDKPVGWTHLATSGEYFTRCMQDAFGAGAELIDSGAPQTDPLVATDAAQRRRRLRASWGIDERTVVTYLPSLRPAVVAAEYRSPDLYTIASALGPEYFWFHREHDDDVAGRRSAGYEEDLRWFAGPISSRTELSDYLLMTDILVSDYSSAIVEFGRTGRPVIHYAPDRDFFEGTEPGTYFSLSDSAAGPIVEDDPSLIEEIKAVPGSLSAGASLRFSAQIAPLDAQISADAVLNRLGL